MPNLTTKMDLTSTTIQIRSDDAKSNFMNFNHKWEAVASIEVSAKVNKSDKFDAILQVLPSYEKEYVNLVCNNTQFDKVNRYYLPDWVFLDGDNVSMEDSIKNVVIELVTGLNPEGNKGMFTAEITALELDIDAEIGFPVLD